MSFKQSPTWSYKSRNTSKSNLPQVTKTKRKADTTSYQIKFGMSSRKGSSGSFKRSPNDKSFVPIKNKPSESKQCKCPCHRRINDFVIEVNSIRHPANLLIRQTISPLQVSGPSDANSFVNNSEPYYDEVSSSISED